MNYNPKNSIKTCIPLLVITASITSTQAELPPDWIAKLPVGSSLSAGMQDYTVDDYGNSYVTGVNGPSYNTDIITAAYDTDGNLIWSHSYNGKYDWHDQGRSITYHPNNGYIYVTGNAPDSQKYANVILLKYDAIDGTLLNSTQYSSGLFTSEYGSTITTDVPGNIYIGGATVGDGPDALILKSDPDGNLLWKNVWDGPAASPYSQDQVELIKIAPDGNPIVLIYGTMSSLHPDYIIIKYNADDGSTIWETNWGLSGADSPNDMEIDEQGDIYVTGSGLDFTSKYSTIKLNGQNGQLIWQAYDSAGLRDYAAALTLDDNNGVYITGSVDPDGDPSNFNNNMYTIKRDAVTGNQIWTHSYGDPCKYCYDVPSDINIDIAGNLFLAGSTSSAPYNSDLITFILDPNTGTELNRGIIYSGVSENAGTGELLFDANYNLYNGGQVTNYDTGQVNISIIKFHNQLDNNNIYHITVKNLIAGANATFTIKNATPNKKQYITYSIQGRGSTPVPPLNITLDITNPTLLKSGISNANGNYQTTIPIPPSASARQIWFQSAELNNTTPVIYKIVQ